MPPRLMHTKSRQGCQRCKARKVKCDEATPSCGACQRHKVCCVYPSSRHVVAMRSPGSDAATVTSYRHSSVGSTSATTPRTPGSARSDIVQQETPRERQLLPLDQHGVIEPRLMHYYMINYDDMFSGMDNSDIDEVWRDQVPAMAFKCHFLLYAAFSVAALHGITVGPISGGPGSSGSSSRGGSIGLDSKAAMPLTPSSSSSQAGSESADYDLFSKAHQYYFNLAVQGHRHAVANINADNADACCIATILIANQGFLLTHDLDFDTDSYQPPVQWLILASAIGTIIQATMPMLAANAAISRIMQTVGHLTVEECNIPQNGLYFRRLLEDPPWPVKQEVKEPIIDESSRECYETAINLLGTIKVAVTNGEGAIALNRRIFAFAPQVPRQFIELLHERRPRALVIIACYFAMTRDVESIWWFRGGAQKHVNGLKSIVPLDWQWALEWPVRVLNSDAEQRLALYNRPTMFDGV